MYENPLATPAPNPAVQSVTLAPAIPGIPAPSETQTAEPCLHDKPSVTPCAHIGCTNPAKKNGKFCSNGCRQAAYRTSPAHLKNLKRFKNARLKRRADYYQRTNRARALSSVRGYGGPITSGVPVLGTLNLRNYL